MGIVFLALLVASSWFYFAVARFYVGNDREADVLVQLAIRTQNPSICGKITDVPIDLGTPTLLVRDGCYASYVTAYPDKNICPAAANACLMQYAWITDEPLLCLHMNNGGSLNCVSRAAAHSNSEQDCDVLTSTSQRKYCENYFTQYQYTGSSSS